MLSNDQILGYIEESVAYYGDGLDCAWQYFVDNDIERPEHQAQFRNFVVNAGVKVVDIKEGAEVSEEYSLELCLFVFHKN